MNEEPTVPPQERRQSSASRVPFYMSYWYKVTAILALLLLCFVLQVTIYSIELHVKNIKQRKPMVKVQQTPVSKKSNTVKDSRPVQHRDLHLIQKPIDSADYYWNQVLLSGILDFEQSDEQEVLKFKMVEKEEHNNVNIRIGWQALKHAAEYGHPYAQWLVANSISAGFWTFVKSQQNLPLLFNGTVNDEWEKINDNQAFISWQMAAISGNVEAAITMAQRLQATSSCAEQLPYLAAAAHGIMDELLADPQSRGIVAPAGDRHSLHLYHLHGGTASRLDADNRPDDTGETLQFYQMRARSDTDSTSASAAFTLARFYHTGSRGAPQNLTLALYYYEKAAYKGHWEAAGQAGTLYLWGIGTQPNALTAHKMFQRGAPGGWSECHDRLQRKIRIEKQQQKNKKKGQYIPVLDDVFLCDNASLNGMGLLRLLGIPMVVSVDTKIAEQFFSLARSQGSFDAAYNLAMMKLGWKTHFKNLVDLHDDGKTEHRSGDALFSEASQIEQASPSAVEYNKILTDLATAANNKHIRAHHRLGMMYESGVSILSTSKHADHSQFQQQQVVQQDCAKAAKHYKWIIYNVSPGINNRMRRAYKQYMAGEINHSLRNYLAVSETGNMIAQENAAFLLERGECLGLSKSDCAKASVRLWKAAAAQGSAEASLRVGDFYYYGRFHDESGKLLISQRPFGWLQYILFPEEYILPQLWKWVSHSSQKSVLSSIVEPRALMKNIEQMKKYSGLHAIKGTCTTDGKGETCEVIASVSDLDVHSENDLASAAHFYRLASITGNSRAHYNMGFMHEWGLGVKQDFPLAKRHYDLAITMSSGLQREAVVPVKLALLALEAHQYLLKYKMSWEAFWQYGQK
jgi:SEL1 protein